MEQPGQSSRRELKGPRPTPLKVKKDSHKIKKPPLAPPQAGPPPQHQPTQPPRPPVVIYAVSPKVIHTSPSGFMSLVQRLTGSDSATTTTTATATMPLGERSHSSGCIRQSILSPGPAGLLRPVPRTFFSPVSDPSSLVSLCHQQNSHLQQDYLNALHEQFQHGGLGGSSSGGMLPSPAAAAFLSPTTMLSPASIEFLTRLLDQ